MKDTGWRIHRVLLMVFSVCVVLGSVLLPVHPVSAAAAGAKTGTTIEDVLKHTDDLKTYLEKGDLEQAAAAFSPIKKWWNANKAEVKGNSLNMSLEIEGQIAGISLAILSKDSGKALEKAGTLEFSLINYRDGAYVGNDGKQKMTLSAYILKLRGAADLVEKQKWTEAASEVKLLQQQWLTVEGDIVSKSATVYSNTERDLVLLDAYIASPEQRQQVKTVIDRMIDGLVPLADAQYTWVDAALIPIREGLEALLVVGALLMYSKKAGSKQAGRWVIGGSAAGLLTCIGVGFAVAFFLTSSAFGRNNSLINGWTGVLASFLLLYVSYWLHRNADVQRWKQFLAGKSSKALSGGKMFSIALLAFFAIVREGLETVIFLIGMVGKMPGTALAGGIAAGFGVLALCAVVIVKAGTRLPVRPVFLASSVIVFYLCFKFMGSGIHSLQMAGVLPSTVHEYLPEYAGISLYPSWYSTFPQLIFVLVAVVVLLAHRTSSKRTKVQTI
ncbi:FTR1 family protein [Paenibacillus sp. J22TS3]|uniref:FTR1 family iron permease n=1 Tax=Paenibacillus sp. J22TS3 TaxID=2807192 RepID=UPI001B1B4D7B|nr:FTR1 family protein [Paenibacillus sp. J22TS3]GIP23624.1 hypothetical protein J22TS3_38990 [Paenibacillus sp. J22TS3]